MHKKGQAAMEFLMTYGWAILAAIIAIGVLAYFGVFSPGKYTPSATVVQQPFYATGATASEANGISIELQNNGGQDVNITGVTVSSCGTDTTSGVVAMNARSVRTITCAPALAEGDSFRGDITITYRTTGSSLDQTSTGTITQRVVA